MCEQAVEFVFRCEVEVRNGLFGFGQALGDGFANGAQRDDFNTLGCSGGAPSSGLYILVGNATTPTGAGHRAQIHSKLVGQPTHARGERV